MKRTTLGLSVTAALASMMIACSGSAETPATPAAKAPAAAATTAAASAATTAATTPAAAAASSTAAAPGATGTPAAAAATPPPAPAPPAVVSVSAAENGEKYAFEPAAFSVKAGEVTVRFTNKSTNRREHTFIVTNPAGGKDVVDSGSVRPGGSVDLKFNVTAAGQYKFLCAVEGHEDRGQVGMVTVTGG